ncbi:MAG: glycosyltransferase family 4 protein [Ferrovibrionaceae bacterium]
MTGTALLTHLAFAAALVALSAGITRVMIAIGVMDVPNHRSAHVRPTPKSGGIAVVITFLVGIALVYATSRFARPLEGTLIGFIAAAIGIAVVSFIDDVRPRSFLFKLVAQVLAALVVLGFGLVVRSLSIPGFGEVHLGLWAYPLTLVWIIGLTNAVNFMDGINGLTGGVCALAAAMLAVFAHGAGAQFVYLSALILAASAAGFLVYNFPAGRIFLGDVGSQFLGFNLAVLAVIATQPDQGRLSFIVVPFLMFAFIFDVGFTLVRRILAGENPAEGHHGHLYQVLGRSGVSRNLVTLLHYGFVFVAAGAVAVFLDEGARLNLVAVLLLLAVQVVYALLVARRARRAGLGRW